MTDHTRAIVDQLQASREERKAQHSEAAARWEEISRWYRSYPTIEQIRMTEDLLSSLEEAKR